MNLRTYISAISIITVMSIGACKSSKKSTSIASTNSGNPPAAQTNTTNGVGTVGPLVAVKSKDGINPPGEEELNAIKPQMPDVTMTKLNEGHELYSKTTCTRCHNPKNIYKRDVGEWKGIIDDMATRAQLTASQKEAVYAYVMSIKATQPK